MGDSLDKKAADAPKASSESAPPPSPRRKRRRRRKPTGDRGAGKGRKRSADLPPTNQERARLVLDGLRALVGQIATTRGLEPGEQLPVERVAMPISLSLDGSDDPDDIAALLRAIEGNVDEAARALGGYVAGHVYCFQCDKPGCSHALPTAPGETFAGYSATGKPLMKGFAELCMERNDDRVAQVYGDPPQVVAFVQSTDELQSEQLPDFGGDGRSLAVLGQVVAGLLPEYFSALPDQQERVAIAIQIVETRGQRGGRRLRLNLLGTSWATLAAVVADQGPGGRAASLADALAVTRRKLRARGRDAQRAERRGDATDLPNAVAPLLNDLRRDVERIFRGHRFRTQHADLRRRQGERPTMAAVAEARLAPANRLLRDRDRDTIVVVGKKGRAHVFTAEGWHVTSLQLRPNELARKTERGRWRALEAQEVEAFRASLERPADGE